MKRFFLLMLLAVLISGIASAQNANRSGFFLELGIGGLIGNTPRESFSITNNIVENRFVSGAAGDFGFGGRFRIGNHWSYEVKAEASLPLSNPLYTLVGRGLPIGFRYTSVELFQNYSLFVHFNLGGAIVVNRGYYYDYDKFIYPDMKEVKLNYIDGGEGYGIAYAAGVGLNITTHFYAEGCFDAQAIFDGVNKNGRGLTNYGSLLLILGYRF